MHVILLGIAVIITAAAAFLAAPLMSRAPQTATVRIPRGATIEQLADTLTAHFGPDYSAKTISYLRLMRPDMASRSGQYRIEKGTPLFKVVRRLGSGAQTPIKITVNGYRNLDSLINGISQRMEFTPEEFRKTLLEPLTLKKYGLTPENIMSLFVNDSYEFYWTATPGKVIEKMGKNYLDLWNDSNRVKASRLGLTPSEVMIIASISEEESNDRDERGVIGRLYTNRYKKGMRLQADPTVKFAVGDFGIKRITSDHLATPSPYNTYRNNGLPPGPIRTVDKRTVESILNSRPHDYIYMCAKEDFSGTHNFAVTFQEHSQNAQRYRQALNAHNIH